MQRRVLIVEDEPDIARLVREHLADVGCDAVVAADAAQARARFAAGDLDLVVLDRMLPDGDGLVLCGEFRRAAATLPILMLTAKSTELDRVVGLEVGADDYLVKPFSVAELQARVKALLRRVEALREAAATPPNDERLEHDGLEIDVQRRAVHVAGEPVELTAREFDLLLFFARHPGRVFSRMQLLDKVWGYNHEGYEHTVNSHINRLRAKIEPEPARPRYVLTVWGVGYKFAEPPAG
ncbi:MAG: response regulator [Gammaproteobacteria bacterium]|jgi:DNA-binding response OmpR family regulator|nr:response regulator [Gammaproteobacteria bacterium]